MNTKKTNDRASRGAAKPNAKSTTRSSANTNSSKPASSRPAGKGAGLSKFKETPKATSFEPKETKDTRPPRTAPSSKSEAKREGLSAKDRGKYVDHKFREKKGDPMPSFNEDAIRLNKYLSNAGICSRREADVLIQSGVVTINDVVVTEMGHKIKPGDIVKYDGGTINAEAKRYVLLNKPKDFITTMDDPQGRKTVMTLVDKACKERVYPVGRLDKDTTGMLLFTNDGDLAKKLTHPRYKATKVYHVELNKACTPEHLRLLVSGVTLEDGTTMCDKAEFVEGKNGHHVGVEIHSGKNRIVRRLFESLGYIIFKLDRMSFAGLNKKDLPRGFYRHLTEKEVAFLKMSK
jgi:23S rRNA pseudouridine2605 synthase